MILTMFMWDDVKETRNQSNRCDGSTTAEQIGDYFDSRGTSFESQVGNDG